MCAMSISGCLSQSEGESVRGIYLEFGGDNLIGTDEFLYAADGRVICFDWEGNIIWETPNLGSGGIVSLGDAFFVTTYDSSEEKHGVALLNLEGQILWQKETKRILSAGIGASQNLLAAGSHGGTLWAFSQTGDNLWTYNNYASIEQVVVAPDSSCVLFTDFNDDIKCVRDGELVWSKNAGSIYTGGHNRTVAFSPDSSYVVYKMEKNGSHITASTLEGEELWSSPLESALRSVAITDDGQYIIGGCSKYVYKFTSKGDLVWESKVGSDNKYIAVTPEADYIVVGSVSAFSKLIVLNKDGETLWNASSSNNIYAVAISPDGKHAAFSNKLRQLYLFENPPPIRE